MRNLSSLSVTATLISCVLFATGSFAEPRNISAACEEQLALSALPKRLRATASAYVLYEEGFRKVRDKNGPFTCIVERNHEKALIPQCVDAAGADTIIPGIMLKTEWVLAGHSTEKRREMFQEGVSNGRLQAPSRAGVSYMMSAFNHIYNGQSSTFLRIGPHVMFYAPSLSNDDIGGSMREGMGSNRGVPFIVDESIHGFMTSMVEHAADSADALATCQGQIDDIDPFVNALEATFRTDKDRAQDSTRKPSGFLSFAGIGPGDTVVEINAGSGYLARLVSSVVGGGGQVYATNADFVLALFDGINDRLGASVENVGNIEVSTQQDARLQLPSKVDTAILSNIYHDLHWQQIDVASLNQEIFAAVKPGGYLIVSDHSASSGRGDQDVARIHRIDRELVINEIEAAGFELVDSTDFLANPADDRQSHVIDHSIRGKTDRFLLKFKRPE